MLLGVAGGEGGLLREVVILAEDVARAERGSTQDMLGRRVALHGAHAVGDRGSPREGRLQLVTGVVLLVDRELLTANLMVTLHEREGVARAAGHDGEADAVELAPVLHELAHVAAAGIDTEHFRCAGPSDPVALQRAALGFGFLVLHGSVEGEARELVHDGQDASLLAVPAHVEHVHLDGVVEEVGCNRGYDADGLGAHAAEADLAEELLRASDQDGVESCV